MRGMRRHDAGRLHENSQSHADERCASCAASRALAHTDGLARMSRRPAPPHRRTTPAPIAVVASYDSLVRHADTLRRRGAYTEAVQAFHAITLQHPHRGDAFSNLAGMLQAAGHSMLALQTISRALELDPSNVAALQNSAEILKDFGEWPTVLATYDAALERTPDAPALRFARALQLLMLGRWQEGWREHEQRAHVPDMPLQRTPLRTPTWDGSPLDGRHILLDHEQGLGDQIMCARFAADVVARGGRVTMRCSAALEVLFGGLSDVRVNSDGDAVPAHDVHASLMSLPYLLGVNTPTALHGTPYLSPVGPCPASISEALDDRHTNGRARVGLVWAGNPHHRNDARRSVAPALLQPLLEAAGAQLVSLQHHDANTALPDLLTGRVLDLGASLHSLNDTAHALRQLDLLITVDTSVAHLAGALGVPTLVLVPFVPDWRWMIDRSDTPWYRSVTLLRQSTIFDWCPVLAAARAHVDALTGSPR